MTRRRALLVGSMNPVAAAVLRGWTARGHEVAGFWRGSRKHHGSGRRDARVGLLAPRWSVRAVTRRHGIPVREVPRLATWDDALREVDASGADVLISVYFPYVVPPHILERFGARAVNLHPAPLPRYRGPSPIGAMVLDGTLLTDAAMTLHVMTPGLDEGPIIAQQPIRFDWRKGIGGFTAASARAAEGLVRDELHAYLAGEITATPQDESLATYPRIGATDTVLTPDLTSEAMALRCRMLGERGRLGVEGFARAGVTGLAARLGPPTGEPPRIGLLSVEMNAADARVRLSRKTPFTRTGSRARSYIALVKEPRDGS